MSSSRVDISPARAMAYVARYRPTATSIVYDGGDVTAAVACARANALATALARGGVTEGARVAWLGMNSPTLLLLHLACAQLRAVFVPVNFRLAAAEIAHILRDAGVDTLVAEPPYLALVESVADRLPVRRFVCADDDSAVPLTEDPGPRWETLSVVLAEAEAAIAAGEGVTPSPCHDEHLAALLYTSGTTGMPKGVMLTHGNLWWNQVNVEAAVDTRVEDVTHVAAPLFHIGGLNSFALRTLVRGGTVVVRRAFAPAATLQDFVALKVNTLFGVPAMYAAIAREPGFADADLSQVRCALVAGAPVPPSLVTLYAEHGVMLQQAWGLTETSPFATYLPASQTRTRVGSCGVPMPYTSIKLIDVALGAEVTEPDVRGEVLVRGPNVTQGYWNNPEATAKAFDDEGWFHTGDIGQLDGEGFLYLVDRLKDMIITGGENVYPAEVEHALTGMPGVLDVAVVGAPDPTWGETVVAVLTCADGAAEPTVEDVRAFASGSLARYKLPTRIVIVPELPRTGTGKLDKKALRGAVTAGA